MSRTPEIPAHLHPLAPGYSPTQIQLDAEMVALGRPSLTLPEILSASARTAHQVAVEAWEAANPEASGRWLELRAQAKAEEARLYAERYGPDAFAFEQMRVAGFSESLLVRIRSVKVALFDTRSLIAAREWLLDGTTWALVLSGPPGCGKSQAAVWLAHQMLMRSFAPRCVMCQRRSEEPLYGDEAEEYRWRCAEQAGVLLLDDLGEGEQRNEKRSAWRAWVDDVLTRRHAARRKTIVTTNRSAAELAAWLGSRLVDRLNEGVIVSTNEGSLRGQPRENGGST